MIQSQRYLTLHVCSYSYDITNSLQKNLTVSPSDHSWNTRFMWNHHLLSPVFDLEEPKGRSQWVLPLIHGFVDQASETCSRCGET